jgi:hypothetical protein
MTAVPIVLRVPCPTCDAAPKQKCVTPEGNPRQWVHPERFTNAWKKEESK